MEVIITLASAHPILAWLVAGVAALIVVIALGYSVLRLWVKWHRVDRSGAKLVAESLTIFHDDKVDELVFTCPLHNQGKFACRDLHVGMSLVSRQKTGLTASWRFNRTVVVLEPGDRIDLDIRISRPELARLAGGFDTGTIGIWSNYSPSPPGKAINSYGAFGPRVRYALAVGEVHDAPCLMVTDFTPVDRYRYL